MSTCVRCRAVCSDGAAFCGVCGAPQPHGSAPPGYQPPGYQPPGYQPPGYQPPEYAPPGPPSGPPPGYPPPGYPPTGYPFAPPALQARRGGHGVLYLLIAVVVLGAAAFGVYRLNLVPALTTQIDTLIGTTLGPRGNGPTTSFVAADGTPVDADSFGEPSAADAAQSEASAAHPFVAAGVDRGALDSDLKSIETAFASKDPAKVLAWVHPDAQALFKETFEANADRLVDVASLLATRKPVFVGTDYAEYEVIDKGRPYTVVYQRSGDHWMLLGL